MLTASLTVSILVLSAPLGLFWIFRLIAMIRLPDAALDTLLLRDLRVARRILRRD